MDTVAKARRSQALIDSIGDLIALERDVSLAADSCKRTHGQPPQKVMVPLTEVAFLSGTVASDTVMVGLGQDYFVERTPQQAQEVLRRRMADLSRKVEFLAESALLVPESPSAPAPAPAPAPGKSQRQKTKGGSDTKSTWAKGFLSTARELPLGHRQTSRKGRKARATATHDDDTPDESYSPAPPTEVKHSDSEGREHMEVEDAEHAPIMEIREWLDESGNQTSVDITDLGKVLRAGSKVSKTGPSPPKGDAGAAEKGKTPKGVPGAPAAKPIGSARRSLSDLDSVLATLEEEERMAEKEVASPSLGPEWKKGFLDGAAKRSARASPSAATGARENRGGAGTACAVPTSDMTRKSEGPVAFLETVVEKPNVAGPASPLPDSRAAPVTAPARISRFKARRQGL